MKSGQLAAFYINGNAIFKEELSAFSNKEFLVDAMSGTPPLRLKSKLKYLLPSKISPILGFLNN